MYWRLLYTGDREMSHSSVGTPAFWVDRSNDLGKVHTITFLGLLAFSVMGLKGRVLCTPFPSGDFSLQLWGYRFFARVRLTRAVDHLRLRL